MKSSYAIAYSNKDGTDFNGTPWILEDINSKEECILIASKMITDGFLDVIPFQFMSRRQKQEEYSWGYVKENRLDAKI